MSRVVHRRAAQAGGERRQERRRRQHVQHRELAAGQRPQRVGVGQRAGRGVAVVDAAGDVGEGRLGHRRVPYPPSGGSDRADLGQVGTGGIDAEREAPLRQVDERLPGQLAAPAGAEGGPVDVAPQGPEEERRDVVAGREQARRQVDGGGAAGDQHGAERREHVQAVLQLRGRGGRQGERRRPPRRRAGRRASPRRRRRGCGRAGRARSPARGGPSGGGGRSRRACGRGRSRPRACRAGRPRARATPPATASTARSRAFEAAAALHAAPRRVGVGDQAGVGPVAAGVLLGDPLGAAERLGPPRQLVGELQQVGHVGGAVVELGVARAAGGSSRCSARPCRASRPAPAPAASPAPGRRRGPTKPAMIWASSRFCGRVPKASPSSVRSADGACITAWTSGSATRSAIGPSGAPSIGSTRWMPRERGHLGQARDRARRCAPRGTRGRWRRGPRRGPRPPPPPPRRRRGSSRARATPLP